MAPQSQPDSPNSSPGFGVLFGLLLAGAMLGVFVFGAMVAIFDAVRDQAGLKWSEELIAFAIGCLLFALMATIFGCYFLARLMRAVARPGVSSSRPEVSEPAQRPEPVYPVMLYDPPPSVTEHTTHLMNPRVQTLS